VDQRGGYAATLIQPVTILEGPSERIGRLPSPLHVEPLNNARTTRFCFSKSCSFSVKERFNYQNVITFLIMLWLLLENHDRKRLLFLPMKQPYTIYPIGVKFSPRLPEPIFWTKSGVGTTVSVRIPLRDPEPEAMGPGASHASLPGLDRQESTP
jgi:hypothetical protein